MQATQQRTNTSNRRSNGRGRYKSRKPATTTHVPQVSQVDRAHLQALLEERVGQVPGHEPHRSGYQRTLERINSGEEKAYSVAEALNNAVVNCLLGHRILPYGMPGVRSLD